VSSAIRLDSYPGALEQVITNLINNAVLHGQRHDRNLSIHLSAQLQADISWVKLSVCDDGLGMSPEVAAQAFSAFFTTRANHGGSGLGLHLVRQLVQETLGGSLELDTQSGRGTCFDIVLPLQAPLSPKSPQ
jgi:signal transduction histidine kinase